MWLLLSRVQFEMRPSRAKSSKVGVIFDVPQLSTSEASLGHGSDNDTGMEDEPKTNPADVRLDSAARVRAERTSDTMDLKDPYRQRTTHQCALCSMGGRSRWHTRSTSLVVYHRGSV